LIFESRPWQKKIVCSEGHNEIKSTYIVTDAKKKLKKDRIGKDEKKIRKKTHAG
jgi:hypothetical protein